ncbi:MAG: nitroreductase [Spirochaetes bacterium]|nr:nitroreductase [Spirochaetota bacterium]
MDVIEAINSRHSIREFSSEHVSRETLNKIIEAAVQSPSGGNSQPWEVFAAAGETLEKIRKIYLDRSKSRQSGPKTPPPSSQPAEHTERMAVIRKERFELLGLDPEDPASGNVFFKWAANLFGAPLVLFICMDKSVPPARSLNIGTFVQTACLAAKHYGVDSFIAGQLLANQDVLREELAIPENYNIEIGIALGYPKPDSIINTYRSPRRSVNEVLRYKS